MSPRRHAPLLHSDERIFYHGGRAEYDRHRLSPPPGPHSPGRIRERREFSPRGTSPGRTRGLSPGRIPRERSPRIREGREASPRRLREKGDGLTPARRRNIKNDNREKASPRRRVTGSERIIEDRAETGETGGVGGGERKRKRSYHDDTHPSKLHKSEEDLLL